MAAVTSCENTPHRIDFAPPRKSRQKGHLFTHKNGCGGAFSVTGRSRDGPADLESENVTYRIGFVPYFGAVNTY